MASNLAAELMTAIPAGYTSNRFGRKKTIILGLLGVSFAFMILCLRGTTMGIYDSNISIGTILGLIYGGVIKDLF
ncbi:MAG: hypothetical protein J7K58_05385 [Euryarchaeota archaeon]|nr:hypothetical protein [Euryarchaeota archaeon]